MNRAIDTLKSQIEADTPAAIKAEAFAILDRIAAAPAYSDDMKDAEYAVSQIVDAAMSGKNLVTVRGGVNSRATIILHQVTGYVPTGDAATAKQVALIAKLQGEKPALASRLGVTAGASYTTKQASRIIDVLIAGA